MINLAFYFLMYKSILFIVSFFCCIPLFSEIGGEEKIKPKKLGYNDFGKYSINDTSAVIIDIFFDKKDNAAYGQMSFFPITAALAIFPPTRIIGMGTSLISFPLFLNGSYMLVKYRKKKLYNVLIEYKKSKTLPNWVRKKANKQLEYYEMIKVEY